jgi:hypothetical protein
LFKSLRIKELGRILVKIVQIAQFQLIKGLLGKVKIKITGILGKVIEQTNATKNKIKFRISPILFIRSRVKMIVWELFTVIKVKGSGGMNAWVKKGNLQILKIHLRAIFFIFIFIFILGVFLYGVIIYYGGAIIS